MNNIKILRLQSGEDIIANYSIDEESGVVELNRPMTLFFKRLPTGKSVMIMGPWLPVELIQNNTASLYTQDILTVISPKEYLINYYNDVANETEETLKEQGDEIDMTLSSQEDLNEEDIEDDDEDWDMEEILKVVKERKTIH
jgi:hypothetical protein